MIIERILVFLEYKGISKNKFYKDTGLSNGFLNKVKDIGTARIPSIINSYPDLNLRWLILGKGSMLNEEKDIYKEKLNEDINSENNVSSNSIEDIIANKLVEKLKDFFENQIHINSKEFKDIKETLDVLEAIIGYNVLKNKLEVFTDDNQEKFILKKK